MNPQTVYYKHASLAEEEALIAFAGKLGWTSDYSANDEHVYIIAKTDARRRLEFGFRAYCGENASRVSRDEFINFLLSPPAQPIRIPLSDRYVAQIAPDGSSLTCGCQTVSREKVEEIYNAMQTAGGVKPAPDLTGPIACGQVYHSQGGSEWLLCYNLGPKVFLACIGRFGFWRPSVQVSDIGNITPSEWREITGGNTFTRIR
jgi:hypothetical protein